MKLSNLLMVVLIATTSSLKASEEITEETSARIRDAAPTLGFLGASVFYFCSKAELTGPDFLFLCCLAGFTVHVTTKFKECNDLREQTAQQENAIHTLTQRNNFLKSRNSSLEEQIQTYCTSAPPAYDTLPNIPPIILLPANTNSGSASTEPINNTLPNTSPTTLQPANTNSALTTSEPASIEPTINDGIERTEETPRFRRPPRFRRLPESEPINQPQPQNASSTTHLLPAWPGRVGSLSASKKNFLARLFKWG